MSRFGIVPFFEPFGLQDLFEHQLRLLDEFAGTGTRERERPQASSLHDFYVRPRMERQQSSMDWGRSEVSTDPNKMQVMVDVSQFTPDEITVKTVDDSIVIEGKHAEKIDEHGFISRQFRRRYVLPANVEPEKVTSTLAHDGILTIEAPAKKPLEIAAANERIVPILQKTSEKSVEN